jgi:hypothetical protein
MSLGIQLNYKYGFGRKTSWTSSSSVGQWHTRLH